jgi:hypothetical protein
LPKIGLVGCSRLKLAQPAPACELYVSPLFKLASRYCAATCDLWFVLSALHGLVGPEEIIEPYDQSLRQWSRAKRNVWAERVVGQMRGRGLLAASNRFLLHAGATYANPLVERLKIEQPLKGLGIGERLCWYRRQLAKSGPKEE